MNILTLQKFKEMQYKEIIRLRKKGLSLISIGKMIGVSGEAVRKIIIRNSKAEVANDNKVDKK